MTRYPDTIKYPRRYGEEDTNCIPTSSEFATGGDLARVVRIVVTFATIDGI